MQVFVLTVCTNSDPPARVCFAEAEAANKDEEANRKTISKAEMQSLVSHKENKPLVRLIVYFWTDSPVHPFREDVKH